MDWSYILRKSTNTLLDMKVTLNVLKILTSYREIITNEEFKRQFMIKPNSAAALYYEMIICHSLFLECFLNTSLKKITIILKEQSESAAINNLRESLLNYIKDNTKIINDILYKSLPSNFKLENKEDVFVLLKEFAKLLINSMEKLEHITSQPFLDNFFARLNLETNRITPQYLNENIETIKRSYVTHISITLDHSLVYKIFSFISQGLIILAVIKTGLTIHAFTILLYNLTDFTQYYALHIINVLAENYFPQQLITRTLLNKLLFILIKTTSVTGCVQKYLDTKDFDIWIWTND